MLMKLILCLLITFFVLLAPRANGRTSRPAGSVTADNSALAVTVEGGALSIGWKHFSLPRISQADCGLKLNGEWITPRDYPLSSTSVSPFNNHLGKGERIRVTCSGLAEKPDLEWLISLYDDSTWLTLQARAFNNQTDHSFTIEGIRVISAGGGKARSGLIVGREERYRILSERFANNEGFSSTVFLSSERPAVASYWIQMLTRSGDGATFLTGCLEARRFISLIDTSLPPASGSAESPLLNLTWELSQLTVPADHEGREPGFHFELHPGEMISSEVVFVGASGNWSRLLDSYGRAFKRWNRIESVKPAPMTFCSWSAWYRQVNEKNILETARFVSKHLRGSGYRVIQVDGIGWPAARGNYTHANRKNFPRGIRWLSSEIRKIGLDFGIWAAPFEVSENAPVCRTHPDWLLRDSDGRPVAGRDLPGDRGYVLDNTHPLAREFLHNQFRVIQKEFGCTYFKLDFLDAAIREGKRFNRNLTPLEAMRDGLRVIREAVGDTAYLVAAGAPPWAVAGLVDACRAGFDITHDWRHVKFAAGDIAACYYLHNRFFTLDPDALVAAPYGHPQEASIYRNDGSRFTTDEARTWITVAALTGGLLQLGDDLLLLRRFPERYKMITNPEIIKINRMGKIAFPVDLMDFESEKDIPRFWHLRESDGSDILAIFNWRDQPETASLPLTRIGLDPGASYLLYDIWRKNKKWGEARGTLVTPPLPPHSVLLLRIRPG
jgi:alpha-galactosidase